MENVKCVVLDNLKQMQIHIENEFWICSYNCLSCLCNSSFNERINCLFNYFCYNNLPSSFHLALHSNTPVKVKTNTKYSSNFM